MCPLHLPSFCLEAGRPDRLSKLSSIVAGTWAPDTVMQGETHLITASSRDGGGAHLHPAATAPTLRGRGGSLLPKTSRLTRVMRCHGRGSRVRMRVVALLKAWKRPWKLPRPARGRHRLRCRSEIGRAHV